MKKDIFEASEEQLDAILAEYGMAPGAVPPVEWSKPGSYIQMMTRRQLIEERRQNDIILIPIGCTENHGMHLPSATDTLFVSQIIEGVRRYTAKQAILWPSPCRLSTSARIPTITTACRAPRRCGRTSPARC